MPGPRRFFIRLVHSFSRIYDITVSIQHSLHFIYTAICIAFINEISIVIRSGKWQTVRHFANVFSVRHGFFTSLDWRQ